MKSNYRKSLGRRGEREAAAYLRKKGFKILAMNFTTAIGEIDIVAGRDDLIVFVEVKTSLSSRFGPAQYLIDEKKQQRMRKVASQFLSLRRDYEDCRFDVMVLTGDEGRLRIEHISGAF